MQETPLLIYESAIFKFCHEMTIPTGTNRSDPGEDKSGFDNPPYATPTA
jgi:hypothetical protein